MNSTAQSSHVALAESLVQQVREHLDRWGSPPKSSTVAELLACQLVTREEARDRWRAHCEQAQADSKSLQQQIRLLQAENQQLQERLVELQEQHKLDLLRADGRRFAEGQRYAAQLQFLRSKLPPEPRPEPRPLAGPDAAGWIVYDTSGLIWGCGDSAAAARADSETEDEVTAAPASAELLAEVQDRGGDVVWELAENGVAQLRSVD